MEKFHFEPRFGKRAAKNACSLHFIHNTGEAGAARLCVSDVRRPAPWGNVVEERPAMIRVLFVLVGNDDNGGAGDGRVVCEL